MNKKKIFNDPVYGFISIPYPLVFDLIEHPAFQRLRRIRQTGLSDFVYPGALHTRFHHALGAMHLMCQAVDVLRSKGTEITPAEAEAAAIGILLHDIGHGPFSHALEHTLIPYHHEDISWTIMERLNREHQGQLDLALKIFRNEYDKLFLHQLISGQLDMDRMDYLNRDSFFTGVAEGKIGYDRIIKMLAVADGELVVEEKGVYSIEKFLIARRLMYWQVYLHRAVLAAEHMLIQALKRVKYLVQQGVSVQASDSLSYLLHHKFGPGGLHDTDWLDRYFDLDDTDVLMLLKSGCKHEDAVLRLLSQGLVNRRLFRVELRHEPFEERYIEEVREATKRELHLSTEDLDWLVTSGIERNRAYDQRHDEIKILFKNGDVRPISRVSDIQINTGVVEKHFLFYPKPSL